MRKVLSIPFFAAMVVFRAPYDGDQSMWGSGSVIDETGEPVPEVVIMRQDHVGAYHGASDCGHIAVARSDAHGRFILLPWFSLKKDGEHRDLIAYRRQYAMTGISKSGFSIFMTKHSGTNEERLEDLETLARNAPCLSQPSEEVAALLEKIAQEQSDLVQSESQRKQFVAPVLEILQLERERIANTARRER